MVESSPVPASVRAQLLATEHWSLLASRSTTQSEVLTRITIFLTLVSASLVSLALIGQATDFRGDFALAVVVVLGVVVIVGVLTQIRVSLVGMEDLMYVLAMNRLRAAYVELDPEIEPYLSASAHDDQAGAIRTYYFFGGRHDAAHLAGSSMVLIAAVVAALLGLFAAAVGGVFGASTGVLIAAGIVVGLAYLAASAVVSARMYRDGWLRHRPIAPTPA